ncbi:hypothetical protein SISSUDRAFT_1130344 [Sistotremastrum suecicum HHB10207 ss-3]|uniref:DUF6589 domain-containing protein n=1 Tax=Sistotremastrum suecicum HHB10207 ss-3 TaxID=1314776 RepID=A0A166BKE7_9AGAM|nr:hypothetical protein SISSUDRAFT_1130344 [Sistotremastrum suecicum HHB10207 ss-3]
MSSRDTTLLHGDDEGSEALRTGWEDILPHDVREWSPQKRLFLVFSLVVHLNITITALLTFIFSSNHAEIKNRTSKFTSRLSNRDSESFGPLKVWNLWRKNFRSAHAHLVELIVIPESLEHARREFSVAIKSDQLSLRVSQQTVSKVRETLNLSHLCEIYRSLMPFTFTFFQHLVETPNAYRVRKAQKEAKARSSMASGVEAVEDNESDEEWAEGTEEVGEGGEEATFSRNILVVVTSLSMLLFACNRATNYFGLLFGLFLNIEGTSVRVITCLNRLGLSVSTTTIDTLRTRLSGDALAKARETAQGDHPWLAVIDNLNIFTRKSQQRLHNQHELLNITNCSLIKFPPSFRWEAFDVPKLLSLRGGRKRFQFTSLLMTVEHERFLKDAMIGMICDKLCQHWPGSDKWLGRQRMKDSIKQILPSKRPLPVHKTETFPMGVFDVNEGSKKGLIEVLQQIQERSGLSKEEMASRVRPIAGDLLTILNLVRARNERADDVSEFERLSYTFEVSQPFHMGMNAMVGIIRTHFGDSNVNPASLSSHKELLNRKWDPKKPNYADAKSLVEHSLVARLLDCTMKIKGYETYQDLYKVQPSFKELRELAEKIHTTYLDTRNCGPIFAGSIPEQGDHVYGQSGLFSRDALLFFIFEHGVRNGDPGVLWEIIRVWVFSFRGAKQMNYARECLELLIRWDTELTEELREVLEMSWFYNRTGKPGRFIAVDMYLEHLNYWIKRVFISKGSGVTVDNILTKGSTCVEALRSISAKMSAFCGLNRRDRAHKEMSAAADIQALVEALIKEQVHIPTPGRTLWSPPVRKKGSQKIPPKISSVVDVVANGISWWDAGEIRKYYVINTAWNATEGYPLGVSGKRNRVGELDIDREDVFDMVEEDMA